MSRRLELVQQRGAAPTVDGRMSVADRARVIGPQVPGENPVHWIAERAPPRST